MKTMIFSTIVCLVLSVGQNAFAQNEKVKTSTEEAEETSSDQGVSQDEVKELNRKIEILTQEIQNVKSGFDLFPEVQEQGVFGLAPAASKVYQAQKGVTLGGYGEFLYENFASEDQSGAASGKTDQADFLRSILYVGYRFSDRLLFNSEIEFEHGSTSGNVGSVSVELAYIDYLYKQGLNFRAGMVLVPMGFMNELHEPTTFLSAERSVTESIIIPSTWRANGAGIFGSTDNVDYRFYLVNSLDALGSTDGSGSSPASGFSSGGLRGGRQKGAKAAAEDFAITGRVDIKPFNQLLIGTSFYIGQSGQNNANIATGSDIDAWVGIVDGHIDYRIKGLRLRGLVSWAFVNDVEEINAAKSLMGADSVGEQLLGHYQEIGYDVLHSAQTKQKLIPFFRHEHVQTQFRVPSGFSKNDARNERIFTTGLFYQPITQVAVKADYQIRRNKADSGINQWNVSLGYLF